MIPKKCNILYKPVAEELNISETLVEDFISFYYKETRNHLSNLTYPRINIEGLGQFVAKNYFIQQTIPRLQKKLEMHDVSTFSAYFNKKQTETKLENLINLKIKLDDETNKRLEFKKNKNEKFINKNLEK
jgi:hypothetical protein